MPTEALFQNVSHGDPLRFGVGPQFHPERVRDFLDLNKGDVSRLANVSVKSVRFDDATPVAVTERFEEIATICNMVAENVFGGDKAKTALWFRTKNPLLGDVSPRDMIRLRRFDRLRRFVVGAIFDMHAARESNAALAAVR